MNKLAWLMCGVVTVGCGGRPSSWDTPYTPANGQNGLSAAYGLTGSVAVLDPSLGRVTLLSSPSPLKLEGRSIGLGKDLVAARASDDRKTLFALSRGVQPQRTPNDERPQLLLIDGGTSPQVSRTYTLTEPMAQLALDPQNEWAVVYGGDGVVVNLNELVLVNLTQTGEDALSSKTLLSFGGSPRRFTFSAPFAVPGGEARRFLIVERDSDLVLIDLASPNRDAVTIPLPSTDNGGTASPAQVVYDAASASIAVRVTGSTSVLLLQLAPPTKAGDDYSVVPNLVDVGGQASAIDFVHNSQGLRLVALVGSSAVLVEPETATTQSVQMPAAFSGIRRITAELDPAGAGDVALLYGANVSKIAYFNLSGAPGALFRSIEPYDIGVSVKDVIDVPGEKFFDHKILQTPSNQFYVLDLHTRESAPMKTNGALALEVAPDGERVWAYSSGQFGFASVDFASLHPVSLIAERQVSNVFDIEGGSGQRSAIALHLGGWQGSGIGATVLDARSPSTAYARFYSGLELGGLK